MLTLTLMLLACDPKAADDTAAAEDTEVGVTDDETGSPDSGGDGGADDTDDTAPADDTATGGDGGDGGDDGDGGDSDDTGEPDTLFALTGDCEAPEPLPADPLTLTTQLTTGEDSEYPALFMEALDAHVDWDAELAYFAGQAGFITFDISGKKPAHLDTYAGSRQRYYKVEPLGDGLFALANRDIGVHLLDASAPHDITLVHEINERDVTALISADDYLYAGTLDGRLLVYDVSAPGAPVEVDELVGLGNVWDLARSGDWLYAADNELGIVAIDISDRDAPSLGAAAGTLSSAQDIAVDGGHAYVAIGSSGIQIFDLSDPGSPSPVTSVAYGAAVINVDADDGLVWGVNYEDVVVIDVADPANPVMIGAEQTAEWAMCVASQGDRALVGDWGNVDLYEADRAVRSPEADPSRSELYFYDGEEAEAELTIGNRGGDTLNLVGGSSSDSRVNIRVDRTAIEPGEEARVVIDYETPGETVNALLCLATDDPDEPLQSIDVSSTSRGGSSIAVGETAIDFVLQDTDGVTHRLSDHIGSPIVLVYFATW